MNQNVLIGLVLVAVIGIGGVLISKDNVINVNSPVNISSPFEAPSYGAVAGPFIDASVVSIGGVEIAYLNQGLAATSSTICSLPNPFRATSTILAIGLSRTATGIAGTQAFYVSTTTSIATRYGSSTPAFIDNNQQGANDFAISWAGGVSTSSPRAGVLPTLANDGSTNAILGPLEVITVRIATSSPGTFATYMTGQCTVQLQKL